MPGPILVTFDDLVPGIRLGSQLADQGPAFILRGTSTGGPLVVATGAGNALTLGQSGPTSRIHDLQVDFAAGAVFALLVVLDADEAFRLRAFRGTTELSLSAQVEAIAAPPGWPAGPAYRVSIGSPEGSTSFTRIVLDVANGLGSGAGGPEFVDTLGFVAAPLPTDLAVRFGQAANARSWLLPGTDATLLPNPLWAPAPDQALLTIERRPDWDQDRILGGLVAADTEDGAHRFTTNFWAGMRNAQAIADSSELVRFEGFVHVDAVLGLAERWGSSVELIAAKRGNVVTGAGDDEIVLAAASNGPDWGQSFSIATGAGDDRIVLGTLDLLQAGALPGVEAVDATAPFLRQASGKRLDGSGAQQTVWLRAGDGDDQIVLGGMEDRIWAGAGADRFTVVAVNAGLRPDVLYDFDARADVLDLSALDADLLRPGDQAFAWNGAGAGSLRGARTPWGTTELQADRDGDGAIDWTLSLGVYGMIPGGANLIL